MKLRPWNVILFTGLVWLLVGFFLTLKGLKLIVSGVFSENFFISWIGSFENASLVLIACSLLLGFIKGRFVMIKTINRVTKHLLSLPYPLKVTNLYPTSYYILLGSMILLGILCKFLGIPKMLLGCIDLTIGSALINGAMIYFRYAFAARLKNTSLTK